MDPTTDLVDIRSADQLQLALKLAPYWVDFRPGPRWSDGPANTQYGLADAAVYTSILRLITPKSVVEIGSGYSSAAALDARDRYGLHTEFTFVEPYTDRLDRLMKSTDRERTSIRPELVQDTPIEIYDSLGVDDILFVDSTHVLKAGSDVEHLLFRILPRLSEGVLVHFHDCFWPWQYPEEWILERRDWNELYVLHAYLAGNTSWSVALFDDWVWQTQPDLVRAYLPETLGQRPGGLWLRRT